MATCTVRTCPRTDAVSRRWLASDGALRQRLDRCDDHWPLFYWSLPPSRRSAIEWNSDYTVLSPRPRARESGLILPGDDDFSTQSVSAPTQLTAVGNTGTSIATGSLSPASGAMLFAFVTTANDSSANPTINTPAGTLSATWVAVATAEIEVSSIWLSTALFYAVTYTGSGTVTSAITNGSINTITVGRLGATGALSLTDSNGGTSTGTDGTNTAAYTPTGAEDAALYFNAAVVGAFTFAPVTGATEVSEFAEGEGIIDTSWGYDITPTILSTIGATHATPNQRACIVVGVDEASEGGGGAFTQTVGMVPILVA